MSLDTGPYEADIKAQVQAICPRVYVSEVPDGTASPGFPYVVLRWIEPIRMGTDHHMVSSRYDTQRAGVIVTVVSADDDSANKVKNRIKNVLAGYSPPDCGEIRVEGGTSFSTSNTVPRPTTYSREMYLSFVTNLSWD